MKPTPEMIEAAARVFAERYESSWDDPNTPHSLYRIDAEAALTAALSAMWQPIETAPKDEDGPNLWGWQEGEIRPYLMFWDEDEWETIGEVWPRLSPPRPTHWMPIPQPPEAP